MKKSRTVKASKASRISPTLPNTDHHEKLNGLLTSKEQLERQLLNFKKSVEGDVSSLSAIKARYDESAALLPHYFKILREIKSIDMQYGNNSHVDEDNFDKFESTYYETVGKAKELLETQPSVFPVAKPTTALKTKLKPPELPTFFGAYEQWPSFFQMFNSLVHSNLNLTEIIKFHYLRSSLSGKALSLIRSIDFTEANYLVALQTLRDEFENKKIIIRNHCEAIVNLGFPTCICKKKETLTAKDLENIHNKINQAVQSLNALKVDTTSWDPLVVHLATAKFDQSTLTEWEKVVPTKDPPRLQELLEFLKKRSFLLESVERRKSQSIPRD